MINEVKISKIDELIRLVNELPNCFIYRGQANADWQLESSLERLIGARWSSEIARQFEDFSLSQFQSKFHLYDKENAQPSSKLAWLSIMQHHGVPTRLLDFTESPYVALYFAMESYVAQSKSDFAVYAFDYSAILENSIGYIKKLDSKFSETRSSIYEKRDEIFDNIVDRFSYNIAWVTEPEQLNARLDRQAGSFLVSGDKGERITDVLNGDLYSNARLLKLRISADLYEGVFALLRKMNLTSKSLYGDLDGLARSIRMQLQIYAAAK